MDRMVDEMPLRAGNVGRVSKKDRKKKNADARARSVAEQLDANAAAIKANGHLEVARYEDEQSASRFARKEREDWTRAIRDIENGNLDILYLWESSRGGRKLGEWVDFLDLCRERKVLIHVTTHAKTYDMGNRRDRKALIEDGVDNEDETEKTHERVIRALQTNKENGMPHGIVKYGYRRIYDPRTGALLGQEPVPEHAAVCKEIITRVASGEPVSVITNDLDARGVPAPGGSDGHRTVWSRRTVSRLARHEAYIGKIRVNGELIDAQWPAIVDETTFWAAQHVLTAPGRKTTRPGRAKHLLSYIMTCGPCGAPLYADLPRHRMITAKYVCSDTRCRRTTIPMADADAFITGMVQGICAKPDFWSGLVQGGDERVLQARAEAARLRAELDEWAAADISAHAYSIREAKLLPLISSADKRAAELAVPLALRRMAEPGADIAARWDAMPVAARRDAVRTLFASVTLSPGTGRADERITLKRP